MLNRIVNGRFYLGLSPWVTTGANPPTLGATGSSALSGCAQQFADQSTVAIVTTVGSISQSFSIQAPNGSQFLTFNISSWLAATAAHNSNTGIVKVYLFDGQNATETLIGTYNLTATSPTPVWGNQSIDVTSNLPIQGDYGVRFEITSTTDNVGGSSGTFGTYTGVDDVVLITSSAGGVSISANALNSATTTINVSSSAAPIAGQILTATDATHATWQNGSSLAYSGLVSQTVNQNPTGVVSASPGKMLGLAITATPAKSTRFKITATGAMTTGINDTVSFELRYGTGGTPPANGSAATGTVIATKCTMVTFNPSYAQTFALIGVVTGLTLGTLYWFDINAYDTTGGTMTALGINFIIEEV